jgi:FkbM family methyltransferase
MTIKYIFNEEVKVSERSKLYNNYTWENGVVGQISAVEFFSTLIKNEENFTVVDIGAQSGAYSLMSKFFNKTNWFCFEPDPINYECLLENIDLNSIDNVTPKNIAISDVKGEVTLNICKSHRGLNTIGSNLIRFGENDVEEFLIKSDTMDSIFSDIKIDLIKIDTEGCEYNILNGARKIIEKYKPKIFLEYYDINLNQFGLSIKDLDNLISELNYHIVWAQEDNVLIEYKYEK